MARTYLVLACWLSAISCVPIFAAEPMVRLDIAGLAREGQPLHWSDKEVTLLLRDGQLLDFAPAEASNFSAVPGGFRSYSAAEMRTQLVREFGHGYEVGGSGHYVVVYPAGQRDRWATRFEDLYRSFVHYFKARGWTPIEPQFPLVAVVFPNQREFAQHAAKAGVQATPGLLGFYSSDTNRVLLFDATAGDANADWTANAETIIHEAAHQTAFNTGLHNRFGQSPRWVVEGLGTMFEAPGVWNSLQHRQLADRINRGRLNDFRRYAASRRSKNAIAELLSSDRPFQADVLGAYAEAWALSFYLAETEPRKYLQYLVKTSEIANNKLYRGPERLKDFTDIFGTDLAMLDARLLRFIGDLK